MTTIHPRITALGLACLLALGVPALGGCGSAVEGAVEKAAENAIGGNVDINSDGLSVTDSNGNEIQVGEDVSLPGNWPEQVPALDGGKLTTVMVAGDGASVNAMWSTDQTVAEAASAYAAALEAAGYTQDQNSSSEGVETSQWSGNGYSVNLVVSGTDGQTSVLVNAEKS